MKFKMYETYIRINSVEKDNKTKNHKYKKQKILVEENILKYLYK